MKGKFVTFEGCEGVGKSKQIHLLEEYLKRNGIDYYLTREPGGTSVSEQIRAVILDGKNDNMSGACEALLYAAARVQLLDEIIKQKLENEKIVDENTMELKSNTKKEFIACILKEIEKKLINLL